MPFATYSIDPSAFDKIKNVNIESFENFCHHINDLNSQKKAIFLDDINIDTFKIIEKKYKQFDKSDNNPNNLRLKNLLFKVFNTITFCSYKCKLSLKPGFNLRQKFKDEKIIVDFYKNNKNNFTDGEWSKAKRQNFGPKNFKYEVSKFEKEFLGKIKFFLISYKQQNKKAIDSFMIFHKEFSNYIIPCSDQVKRKPITVVRNRDKYKSSIEEVIKNPTLCPDRFFGYNAEKKIKESIKILHNWWKNLDPAIRPKKFEIVSSLKKDHKYLKDSLEENIKEFIFDGLYNKLGVGIKLINEKAELWQHLRHFVFGEKLALVIKSDFGLEIVDPKNKRRLFRKVEFTLADKKTHESAINDIKFFIKTYLKKIPDIGEKKTNPVEKRSILTIS